MSTTSTLLRPVAILVHPHDLAPGDLILVADETLTVESVQHDAGALTGVEFTVVAYRHGNGTVTSVIAGDRDSILKLEVA